MKQTELVELVFPSDMKYLGAVDAVVQDLAREFSCSDKCINDVSTAIVEACTNAIEHGNKYSKTKRVRVAISFEKKTITTQVCDQGSGFDFQSFLDSPDSPDPFSERGRGIIIMKALADGLTFRYSPGKGLCVELTKHWDENGDGEA
jgi:serine/threonine-protein kinase RsbW